jgi:membrane associated rhomboid family serine protease
VRQHPKPLVSQHKLTLEHFLVGRAGGSAGRSGEPLNGFFLLRINDMAVANAFFGTDQALSPEPETPAEPVFFLAPVVVALIAICAGLYLVQAYVFPEEARRALLILASFIPARYSQGLPVDFAYLASPVLYSLLHAGSGHLAVNMIWLAAFGSPLAARIGPWRFLIFWASTAFGAALLHFWVYPDSPAPLVGASGSISGMMGAAARFSFRTDKSSGVRAFVGEPLSIVSSLVNRTVLTFIAVWMAANLLTGLGWSPGTGSSNIAWEAHIGGFLVGFFFVSLFDRPISVTR